MKRAVHNNRLKLPRLTVLVPASDESKIKTRVPSTMMIGCFAACLYLTALSIMSTDNKGHRAAAVPNNFPQPVKQTTLKEGYTKYLECQKDPSCKDYPKKKNPLPHDYPEHPWHWARENGPDPDLGRMTDCKGERYADMYESFHKEGYVIFESCTLKTVKGTLKHTRDYTMALRRDRVQDAGIQEVKDISADPDTIQFIEYLHGGRKVFPFQTLNFPKGTQQPLHSDLIHFDTYPRALMSAAWVALEDMNVDIGPLRYIPGSHLHGTWDFDEIDLVNRPAAKAKNLKHDDFEKLHHLYGEELEVLVKEAGLKEEIGSEIKRGQTLIWAAGLIHGGSHQNKRELSRVSQVTHYYFEGADYYWVPRESVLKDGIIQFKKYPTYCQLDSTSDQGSCAAWHMKRWMTKCPEGRASYFNQPEMCWKQEDLSTLPA